MDDECRVVCILAFMWVDSLVQLILESAVESPLDKISASISHVEFVRSTFSFWTTLMRISYERMFMAFPLLRVKSFSFHCVISFVLRSFSNSVLFFWVMRTSKSQQSLLFAAHTINNIFFNPRYINCILLVCQIWAINCCSLPFLRAYVLFIR